TLVYANEKALATLKGLAGELEKAFGVNVEQIVGGSIHRFHKDSRRIENLLHNPAALPHEAQFTFGTITLKANINSVPGPDGQVLGYIVNWEDVSAKIKTEAEMARVMSMMENAPINVMCTDLNLKLQYLNPASLRTLKTLEQYLPIK